MPVRNRCVVALIAVGCACFCAPASRATGDIPVDHAAELKIQPPLPIWPSDYETITDRSPVFRINGRFPATKYRVELARDAAFTHPVVMTRFRVTDISGITPVVSVLLDGPPLVNGHYYWRAFCGDDAGFWTPPANYRTFFVSDKDADAIVPPARLTHPYLLVRPSEVQAVRDRIARSDHLRRGWQYQLNAAYSALELEPVTEAYAKGGVGQHGNYNTSASWYHRHLENVAFVALVTGDQRLVQKGIEMLMAACAYERWLGPFFDDPKHFDPPWRAALETAMMTEAVATGYDLLYPHLTDAQRQTVRQALADKGIRMLVHDWADPIGSSQLPRHQLPTGNWVMVCSASAGLGALAILNEHPEAPRWARLVRNRVRAWLHDRGGDWFVDNPYPVNRPEPIPVIGPSDPNFGLDSGYKESISYMNYGTRYVCFFADALRRIDNEDLFTHIPANLLDHMAWSIMAWQADGDVKSAVVDFGDEGGTTSWYGDLLAALMKNRKDGLAAWLYRHTSPVAGSPRMLLWYDDQLKPEAPPSDGCMKAFRGIGQVIMRGGWSPGDPMAAIKFRQNRGHHDIGTFYLFGAGGPTIIDSGSANYNSPIYTKYLAWTAAHNVVMVDNENQVRADGQLLAAVGTSLLSAASGQLKAAYPDKLESWTRDIVLVPGGRAIVVDNLVGKGKHQFDLLLHPENPFTLTRRNEVVINSGSSRVDVQVAGSVDLKAVVLDGYHRTLPRKYVRFNAASPQHEATFATRVRWPAPGRASPQTQAREETRPASVSTSLAVHPRTSWLIPATERVDLMDVLIKGLKGESTEFHCRSDARLAVIWKNRGEAPEHVVMLGGKRLLVGQGPVVEASVPIDFAVETGRLLRAQVWAPTAVHLTLGPPIQADHVYANGEEVKTAWMDTGMSLDLPAGDSRLTFGQPVVPRAPRPQGDLLAVAPASAPAFEEDVRTRASSSWTDGLDALDGDVNTAWYSLLGLPMPQWLEVQLPKAEVMSQMEINTGLPAAGRLEAWDPAANDWKLLGRFETTADRPAASISFDPIEPDRLLAVIERIDPANQSAIICSWSWRAAPATRSD